MFSGEITYKVGYGPYNDHEHSIWTFVDVPAITAGSETAQTVRRNAGAESAQMFAYDENGREIYWYFTVNYRDGGSCSHAIHTQKESEAYLAARLDDQDARSITMTRHTEGSKFITRVGWQRDADGKWSR